MMEMVLYRPDTPYGRPRAANARTTPADQPVGVQLNKKKREAPPPRPSHMMGSKLLEMAGCTYVQPSAAPDASRLRGQFGLTSPLSDAVATMTSRSVCLFSVRDEPEFASFAHAS